MKLKKRRSINLLAILGGDFLSSFPSFGLELLLRSPASVSRIVHNPFLRDNLRAVHLPYSNKGIRLNIADFDKSFRKKSINFMVRTIRAAAVLKNVQRYVIHPVALETWDVKPRGDYVTAVESMIEILERAGHFLHGPLCLENNRVYYGAEDISNRPNRIFCDEPEEWIDFARDIAHPQFALCLDTSHAVTTALLSPVSRRNAVLKKFLSAGDLIKHVHWSGNYPRDSRGRNDSHAAIGVRGTQPLWFHRAVSQLNSSITIEIPRAENVRKSLAYLRRHELI